MDNWICRSKGMRCETCIWFTPKGRFNSEETKPQQGLGRCRKRAPTMNGWPVMFIDDWCGEHKLDENKL